MLPTASVPQLDRGDGELEEPEPVELPRTISAIRKSAKESLAVIQRTQSLSEYMYILNTEDSEQYAPITSDTEAEREARVQRRDRPSQ